jgi:hypothetical protein
MRPIRWTAHAVASLTDREIERDEAERAIAAPDRTVSGHGRRQVLLRKYHDAVLGQPMLLCVVIEDQSEERVVLTVYKTSKLDKYLERGAP